MRLNLSSPQSKIGLDLEHHKNYSRNFHRILLFIIVDVIGFGLAYSSIFPGLTLLLPYSNISRHNPFAANVTLTQTDLLVVILAPPECSRQYLIMFYQNSIEKFHCKHCSYNRAGFFLIYLHVHVHVYPMENYHYTDISRTVVIMTQPFLVHHLI